MQFVVHLILGPHFIRVMTDGGNSLLYLGRLHLRVIKLDRQDLGIHIPVRHADAFDFGRFFDALFAHAAIAVHFELGGRSLLSVLLSTCRKRVQETEEEYGAEKKNGSHD